ncbi:hypothetical protein L3X38_018915 [Prunus dulcis]|uniref:Uncharacterized protein n=1 Tax=Prunus dulcis TaxID=3755 RepID=A0AAD4WAX3_PRUDU|nr:hypothetical protein L3X38_018915 [Prunus dulcis]
MKVLYRGPKVYRKPDITKLSGKSVGPLFRINIYLSVTSRDQLRRSTILSALCPPLCRHGFVSGSSRATSQWVTHPGIALAPNSLNFGVPMTPKPVSSQKASC